MRFYAERRSPLEAAIASGLSRNTVYLLYDRLRWRLVLTRYYTDAALSFDEAGLSPVFKRRLRARRGIGPEEVYAHAAELIHWAEEWPPHLTLKHIRQIIQLTGPLDLPPELGEAEHEKLDAYVRYARTELIAQRAGERAKHDETHIPFAERAAAALERYRREYRAASKRLEREMVSRK